jgi:hypothetical protein
MAAQFLKFPLSSWPDEAAEQNPQFGNFGCNAIFFCNPWGVKDTQ